jgi:hypothetical protein
MKMGCLLILYGSYLPDGIDVSKKLKRLFWTQMGKPWVSETTTVILPGDLSRSFITMNPDSTNIINALADNRRKMTGLSFPPNSTVLT